MPDSYEVRYPALHEARERVVAADLMVAKLSDMTPDEAWHAAHQARRIAYTEWHAAVKLFWASR